MYNTKTGIDQQYNLTQSYAYSILFIHPFFVAKSVDPKPQPYLVTKM